MLEPLTGFKTLAIVTLRAAGLNDQHFYSYRFGFEEFHPMRLGNIIMCCEVIKRMCMF